MPKIIKFDDPVVLVGGSDVDGELLKRYAHLPIVAADGGANHLLQASLTPRAIIGDLDSIADPDYWRSVTKVIEIEEQDTTDFEKCLYTVDAPFFIALGFSGNRLDHTLATLHVMQKLHLSKQVILAGGDDAVCVFSEEMELRLPVGTRVSVYPLNRVVFKNSSGLVYPLDGLVMQQGEMIGTSNVSDESIVKIVPDGSGCYALIIPVTQLEAMMSSVQVPEI